MDQCSTKRISMRLWNTYPKAKLREKEDYSYHPRQELKIGINMLVYKVFNKIGDLCFRIWTLIAPASSKRFQYFDTRMFLFNEMDPKFNWKKYEKKHNPYFKKWGFEVSQLDAAYYSRVSGIEANHYLTRSMAVHYIFPYFNRYDFVPAYMDKNIQGRLLGLPDEKYNILYPETVIYNSNGIFFKSSGEECSRNEVLEILESCESDIILKPTVETYGGHGVVRIKANSIDKNFSALMDKYKYNYIFQKAVVQHPVMAEFNATSVNTVRIVTYRGFDKKIKTLYAVLRFGGEGAVMDNACSGGGFTGINIATGELLNRKRYSYFLMDAPMLPTHLPNTIPFWERIQAAALTLHKRLPQLGIVGWDFSISPGGTPVLIEFNPRPGIGFQSAIGPIFSKEELDEIMAHVSKHQTKYRPFSVIRFSDYPERRTVHTKFGAN